MTFPSALDLDASQSDYERAVEKLVDNALDDEGGKTARRSAQLLVALYDEDRSSPVDVFGIATGFDMGNMRAVLIVLRKFASYRLKHLSSETVAQLRRIAA